MSSSSLVYLDADDRISGTTENFVVILEQGFSGVNRVELLSATIANSFYTVQSGYNVLTFKDSSGSSKTATVPEGNYTGSSLATALQTAMTGASTDTITVSYSSTTLKYTIADSTGNFSIDFSLSSNSDLARILGFKTTSHSGTNSYTGEYIADLALPSYLIVEIPELYSGNLPLQTSNKFDNGLFMLPLPVTSNQLSFYFSSTGFDQSFDVVPSQSIKKLSVRIKWPGGLGIRSMNGGDVSLLLRIRTT